MWESCIYNSNISKLDLLKLTFAMQLLWRLLHSVLVLFGKVLLFTCQLLEKKEGIFLDAKLWFM